MDVANLENLLLLKIIQITTYIRTYVRTYIEFFFEDIQCTKGLYGICKSSS